MDVSVDDNIQTISFTPVSDDTNLFISTGVNSETSYGVSLEETPSGYQLIVYSNILNPHSAADTASAAIHGFPAVPVVFINDIDDPAMQAVTGLILSRSESSEAAVDVGI